MPENTFLSDLQDNAKNKHPFRKLEDLNLLDDFLFRQMLLQEDISEEFCRILLSTILGKPIRRVHVVPQKDIPGIDTHRHGIRMDAYIKAVSDEHEPSPDGETSPGNKTFPDIETSPGNEASPGSEAAPGNESSPGSEAAPGSKTSLDAEVIPTIYDIEPNHRYEKETLPRRMRYYHGLIDTQLLASDMSYKALPEVVIITILPYDPFGKKRMVYTIQNQCIEETSLPYDDGAKKIFLYTRGTEGNPRQELCDMLKYLEETTAKNVTNQDIAAVENLVNKVKRRKEVSISYMKSWEWEEMIREDATAEGLQQGQQIGREEGAAETRQEDIKILIKTYQEFGISKEEAISKLADNYHISIEDAQNYIETYWT